MNVPERLATLFPGRALRSYVHWKVRTDPAYAAVREALGPRERSLVDVGCGIGLLAFYLREHGYEAHIIGIDFDPRKIDLARKAATRYRKIDFVTGDARNPLPENHAIVMLDLLHYFDPASQRQILGNAARAGTCVILRQPVRDSSLRYRLTRLVDSLARIFGWMKAESLHYPTREEIVSAFEGFRSEVRPLWGRMPYNTHFFVFRRK
ncbi:MAG: class I SAM-dependent methyltransferase [Acidobacteriota bacterium]